METVDFLDAVKQKHGIPSDTKLGLFLDIPNGMMSRYRNRLRKLSPGDCHKIAAGLDETPDYVMAEIQAEKAQRVEDRAVWKRLSHLAKKGSAVVITAVSIIGLLSLGDTDPASLLAFSVMVFPTQYTLCAYVVLISVALAYMLIRLSTARIDRIRDPRHALAGRAVTRCVA